MKTAKSCTTPARQILKNLGLDKQEISVEDALDTKAIFTGTKFNGDGIITSVTADNEAQARTIADCIATIGSESDRSGESGITAELIEKFYNACTEYAQWKDKANAEILPFGDNTAAAYEACNAVKDKISDFFTRCRLLSFDKTVAESVNVAVTDIDSIASCPIAKPAESGILPFSGINPAWKPAFDKFLALTLDFTPENKEGINEKEWNTILGKFNAYASWIGSKAGCEVESLGIGRIEEILKENRKEELLSLVEKDKALKAESDSIDDVKKLMLYYRDLYRLLKNFVLFSDFYSRAPGVRAVFELGQLYIDQRCCDLCIRVADMSKHSDMAKLSGIFLIYFKCSSKKLGKSMDAVAVMTDGDINDLRPGKNGIFYDLQGNDYDAVITKVVDNPVSINQAFWAPYRKAWEFCGRIINKSAADKDAKINSELQGQLQNVAATAPAAARSCCPDRQETDIRHRQVRRYFRCLRYGIGLHKQGHHRYCEGHCLDSCRQDPADDAGSSARDFRSVLLHRVDQAPQAQSRPCPQRQRLGHKLKGPRECSVRRQAHKHCQISETQTRGPL